MKLALISPLVVMLLHVTVFAEETKTTRNLPFRFTNFSVRYEIHPDLTHSETREISGKVLEERALENSKEVMLSHSTSVQKIEVLEAFTRKANGKKIKVPKDNYQVQINKGHESGGPAFSDESLLTILFPELSVGDEISYKYRLTQTEPIFPGHFSELGVFHPALPYDRASVQLVHPTSVSIQSDIRGMITVRDQSEKGVRTLELRYENREPVELKRRNFSVSAPEDFPGYSFSTFSSYRQIAEAYAARAIPRAAVTERIAKLADEITLEKAEPREQAKAIYDWIVTNMTYAGNCIGVGSVVPRDLNFVLDNKMGDCKDHATLFQALLAAKNIRSVQALVNASTAYSLGRVPLVSSVNHVISYIPQFDLYLDPTAHEIPFGFLPSGVRGKPVLLTENYVDGARTPDLPVGANTQRARAHFKIEPDGRAKVSYEVQYSGLFAAKSQARFLDIPEEYRERMVEEALKGRGLRGKGTVVYGEERIPGTRYEYSAQLEIENFIRSKGSGALSVILPLPSEAPIQHFVNNRVEKVDVPVQCSSGKTFEEIVYEFPEDKQILSLPSNHSDSTETLSYSASYEQKGNIVTVRREYDDRNPSSVCSPQYIEKEFAFIQSLLPNVEEQILYK